MNTTYLLLLYLLASQHTAGRLYLNPEDWERFADLLGSRRYRAVQYFAFSDILQHSGLAGSTVQFFELCSPVAPRKAC
ncbi:hypothetical protein JCM10207_003343 [Rhodosporidiobolus poonsookiae]